MIGKAAKPRCFKNVDMTQLPVIWHSNKKAWMTGKIMESWLLDLNKQMKNQNRKILLFMDNATSHPKMNLSNIEILFFPSNCTSVLQPADQGVIQSTKVNYRKRLLNRLCRLIDTVDNVSELCKKINVLDAVQWLAAAYNDVTTNCIQGCFRRCGFTQTDENIEHVNSDGENEIILRELSVLLTRIDCDSTVDDFIQMDSNVHTESDTIDIGMLSNSMENEEEESDDDDSQEDSQPLEVLSSNDMAVYLEQMKKTALAKGNIALFDKISECLMMIEEEISNKKTKQTTLDNFFT